MGLVGYLIRKLYSVTEGLWFNSPWEIRFSRVRNIPFLPHLFMNCSIPIKQCAWSSFCPVLDHIVVPGQEVAGVDAKVLNGDKIFVTARGSYILAAFLWLVWNREKYELIFIQVNKLQVMKPSTHVWHHTPATPRGRLSSSQAFRSVTFAYDESICWQPTRHFAAKKYCK